MRMRLVLALLFACLLIAPGVVAEDAAVTPLHNECSEDLSSEEHAECHENQDAPGVGLVAAIGALGAVAFLARRRMA